MIWNLIARLCALPPIARAIIALSMRRPFTHIGEYMHRFWLIPFSWGLPFSIRVHHIKRPDADPYLHDHPWSWRTIVLRGWYVEEDAFGNQIMRNKGTTRAATAETFHRIHVVPQRGAWTLFIMGRKTNHWGFLIGDPPRKIYYRDYQSPNGRGDLKEPAPLYEN